MDAFKESCRLMPAELRQALERYKNAEEIRLRCEHPPAVLICGKEQAISESRVNEKQILHILEVATGASIHSAAPALSSGYISYRGLRIGVCGQAVYREGKLMGFRRYSSLSVRIPHECRGFIPAKICDTLFNEPGSTLIAAPPGAGKTTALREMVRCVSERGVRISLIDERGELSGAFNSFELGRCTDVITDMPKAEAAILLLRAMNPQIIAMDEITKPRDIEAIFDVAGCGVSVFATAHGRGLKDMLHRPIYKKLLSEGLFEKLLTISMVNGRREYRLERIDL